MKTILQVAPDMKVKGGISTVLRMYLKTELPYRYNIEFIATHQDGTKFHKFTVMLAGLFKLIYVLLNRKIDIVHIHCGDIPSPYRKYIFFKICRWFKCDTVLHLHGALFIEQFKTISYFWKKRLQTLFQNANVVICLSQSWSNAIGDLFPLSNRLVIPNGILLPKKSAKRDDQSNRQTHIVFLGLIGPRKGVFDLLDVFNRLVGEGYDIRLSIGGNGEVKALKKRISSPILMDRVDYLGWINEDQKSQLLADSDILTLPTYGEGMPISILEAMAHGLAVVSTPVGGIPELVDDGITGYLVAPGDLETLYDKLKTLIEKQDLRLKMGRSGRQKVEDSYDIEKNFQAVSRVYDHL